MTNTITLSKCDKMLLNALNEERREKNQKPMTKREFLALPPKEKAELEAAASVDTMVW